MFAFLRHISISPLKRLHHIGSIQSKCKRHVSITAHFVYLFELMSISLINTLFARFVFISSFSFWIWTSIYKHIFFSGKIWFSIFLLNLFLFTSFTTVDWLQPTKCQNLIYCFRLGILIDRLLEKQTLKITLKIAIQLQGAKTMNKFFWLNEVIMMLILTY